MYKSVENKSTMNDAGSKAPDSAGVQYGLSSLTGFDSKEGGLQEDMSHDAKTGNYPGRPKTNPSVTSGSAKGKSFTIC